MELPLQPIPYPRGLHRKIMQRVIIAQIRRRALSLLVLSSSILALTLALTGLAAWHASRPIGINLTEPASLLANLGQIPPSIWYLEAAISLVVVFGLAVLLSTFLPPRAQFWQLMKQRRPRFDSE